MYEHGSFHFSNLTPQGSTMSEGDKASVSCWTCRRRRVKCDRLLPACQKCYKAAQPCQGYTEKPLRWVNSVASRGKLMGKTIPNIPQSQSIARVLIDPVFQDLSPAKRGYISYCEHDMLGRHLSQKY